MSIINQINTFFHNLVEWIVERLPDIIHRERGGAFNYLVAIMLVGIAMLVRMQLAHIDAGLQYVTFFPAVTLAAVVGGLWPGLFATMLGMSLGTFIFTAPYYSFSIEAIKNAMGGNLIFLMDGVIVCSSIEAMHRYRARYAAELKESRQQEARVSALNKSLDEFTYIAAHDLKEPLRGIHNYASFLKEEHAAQLDENGRLYINSIQRLAERLATLIDSLMAYSRLGVPEPLKAPVDVDAVVDGVIEDLNRLWTKEEVVLRRHGRLGMIQGDAVRIGEVFQNLFSNAAKYNDKPSKWIEVGCDHGSIPPVFYVRDNGIGIAPQYHENIFRLFKRLHEQNKYGEGTGAGLTIVKKIIEHYGGRIWLESAPGVGTVFYFTLSGTS